MARQRSEEIDRELRESSRRAQRKKVVKVLLLGQSESGKSTTLKQFQILHDKAAFDQDRMAWRFVIYLNLVRSIRRILEAITPDDAQPVDDWEEDSTETASIIITGNSGGRSTPNPGPSSAPAYDSYRKRLQPLLVLEQRLVQLLSDPQDNEAREATHLPTGSSSRGDGPPLAPSTSSYSSLGLPQSAPGRSTPRITIPAGAKSSPASPVSPANEPSVPGGSQWKRFLGIGRMQSPKSSHGGEMVGWWEDPDDPVHVITHCARAMSELWNDQSVRRRLASKGIRLEDNGGFYLDQINTITKAMYFPTDEDILKARLKTTGVTEHTFRMPKSNEFRGFDWKIYDVGGSRSQRQAWAPYFDDVNAIIFLAPISAFDQMLAEDPKVNRLEDSISLWVNVVSNRLLADVTMVLFLNKCDLLKRKIESGAKLGDWMTNYAGQPNDYQSVSKYLRRKFASMHQMYSPKKDRSLAIHLTSVTDKLTTRQLISDVRDAILTRNLRASSLM